MNCKGIYVVCTMRGRPTYHLPTYYLQGLQRRHAVDTTLMVHFFGKDGMNELKYEDFRRFMENLQQEVLELEFHEYSKGRDTISELDFAKILLRYTYLDTSR